MVYLGKKECKIIEKAHFEDEDRIMFCLDKYFKYNDGRVVGYVYCINSYPFNTYQKGDYVEIDLDRIANEDKYTAFDNTSVVRKITPTNIISVSGSSSDIVISPSAVNAMKSPETREIIREMSRAVDDTGKEVEYKIQVENKDGRKISHSLILRKQN